jgi:hypothetical protein
LSTELELHGRGGPWGPGEQDLRLARRKGETVPRRKVGDRIKRP